MSQATTTTPFPVSGTQAAFPAGQKLQCGSCGSEIEILKPCSCQPPDQVLKCCGKDMVPSTSA